ncbi:response regulator transcription factor [Streptomyces sp. DSM 40750]|uniref:response regulator transcription factor n=1 Tax=Streptomyces sp. DSM 40750 TaxID=2801030 RepID=UPI00214B6AC0|nr:response regulator transcription factor [Streptomyces sp. DSM 40750]UUU25893.1 response regulator transcription factor [Streptomyces sp. DSM 40750]
MLLADDEKLILEALSVLLAMQDDLEVVAVAENGLKAVELAKMCVPDICVLDLRMPGADGISVIKNLRRTHPTIRCIIITSNAKHGHLKQAMTAGARGFVSKGTSAEELAHIIRMVYGGARYVDPDVMADVISVEESPLTRRETDILTLAADGAPIDEVAQRAVLAPGTVRNYLSSITVKLKVANRHEAAHVARQHGWI